MQDTPSAWNYKVHPVLQHHNMKVFRKACVISYPFLILALRLGWVISDTLPLGNGHWIGSWNGTRISLDMVVNPCPCLELCPTAHKNGLIMLLLAVFQHTLYFCQSMLPTVNLSLSLKVLTESPLCQVSPLTATPLIPLKAFPWQQILVSKPCTLSKIDADTVQSNATKT